MSEQVEAILSAVDALAEESQQVKDLLKLEENYSKDIVKQLKKMMARLEGPFKVNPQVLKGKYSTLAECALSSEGIVRFFYRSGKIIRLPLEDVSEDTVFDIVMEVLPQVERAISEQKDKAGKSSTIAKISAELKKILGKDSN